MSLGFIELKSTTGTYVIRKEKKDSILIIWVDDIIELTNWDEAHMKLLNVLRDKYNVRELGRPKYFLGMAIKYSEDDKVVQIGQKAYIEKKAIQCSLENCSEQAVPLVDNNILYGSLQESPDLAVATNV